MDPRLLRFYNEHLLRFGTRDARGLGWRDAVSQYVRFQVLADVGDLTGASILDEGCGFGDLYPYLTERFSGISYTGIDVNAAAIEAARERYPEAAFIVGDFSEYLGGPFDYVLSSGALTFNMEDGERIYKEHMRKMYELASKAAAFNVLDGTAIVDTTDYLGWDPDDVEVYCRSFASRVMVRHDYSAEDFTVYMYR